MIEELLRKMGLTNGEIQVYTFLLELNISKVGEIMKKAKISSSKVYEVLERLLEKGLVSYIIKDGIKHYNATPPERLIDFLEEKKETMSFIQEEIKEALPEINLRRKKQKEKNPVIVYTGLQEPKIVLKETIEAGKNGFELLGFGTDEDPYKDYLPGDIQQHFRDQKKYSIKWKLLFNGKFQTPSPLAEVKYLPEGFNLPIRTMIYGEKVAIVDFNEPVTTIIIEKKEIVENYTKFFNYLWKIAKK